MNSWQARCTIPRAVRWTTPSSSRSELPAAGDRVAPGRVWRDRCEPRHDASTSGHTR